MTINQVFDDGEVLGAMMVLLTVCAAIYIPNLCYWIRKALRSKD